MTSPDLRATKPSAAIRIMLEAANESSFKRLRIDALADEDLAPLIGIVTGLVIVLEVALILPVNA